MRRAVSKVAGILTEAATPCAEWLAYICRDKPLVADEFASSLHDGHKQCILSTKDKCQMPRLLRRALLKKALL